MTEQTPSYRMNTTDTAVMRALSHPARLAVLDYLSTVDEATATECARVADLSPSAMSYHLRTLAKAGLIAEAPGRGDNRERVWRRVAHSLSVSADDSPEAHHAETVMTEAVVAAQDVRIRHWLAERAADPPEWAAASAIVESTPYLTAEELAELVREFGKLLAPYEKRGRKGASAGSRRVSVTLRAFPSEPAPTDDD